MYSEWREWICRRVRSMASICRDSISRALFSQASLYLQCRLWRVCFLHFVQNGCEPFWTLDTGEHKILQISKSDFRVHILRLNSVTEFLPISLCWNLCWNFCWMLGIFLPSYNGSTMMGVQISDELKLKNIPNTQGWKNWKHSKHG